MCAFTIFPSLILILILILMNITLRARIANRLVEDSRCRGGIVNIRVRCSSVHLVRLQHPKVLWRFRVSTSDSPSDHTWLHPYTHLLQIDHIYAQQGIRVYGDDRCQLLMRQ